MKYIIERISNGFVVESESEYDGDSTVKSAYVHDDDCDIGDAFLLMMRCEFCDLFQQKYSGGVVARIAMHGREGSTRTIDRLDHEDISDILSVISGLAVSLVGDRPVDADRVREALIRCQELGLDYGFELK